jgi:DNA-binding CsgD family transcriptional regulator
VCMAWNLMTSGRTSIRRLDSLRRSRATVAAAMRSDRTPLELKIYKHVGRRVPELELNGRSQPSTTITAIVGYCLDAIEQGPAARMPIPQAALERARAVAREGSPIGPLLRAVEAGYQPFVDDVIAKAQGLPNRTALREHLRDTYGRLVGDIAAALEREYERERAECASRVGEAEDGSKADSFLTPRQREVLELLKAGRSYKEIAQALHLTSNTVHTHASRIYRRLGVEGRGELAKVEGR